MSGIVTWVLLVVIECYGLYKLLEEAANHGGF